MYLELLLKLDSVLPHKVKYVLCARGPALVGPVEFIHLVEPDALL